MKQAASPKQPWTSSLASSTPLDVLHLLNQTVDACIINQIDEKEEGLLHYCCNPDGRPGTSACQTQP